MQYDEDKMVVFIRLTLECASKHGLLNLEQVVSPRYQTKVLLWGQRLHRREFGDGGGNAGLSPVTMLELVMKNIPDVPANAPLNEVISLVRELQRTSMSVALPANCS